MANLRRTILKAKAIANRVVRKQLTGGGGLRPTVGQRLASAKHLPAGYLANYQRAHMQRAAASVRQRKIVTAKTRAVVQRARQKQVQVAHKLVSRVHSAQRAKLGGIHLHAGTSGQAAHAAMTAGKARKARITGKSSMPKHSPKHLVRAGRLAGGSKYLSKHAAPRGVAKQTVHLARSMQAKELRRGRNSSQGVHTRRALLHKSLAATKR